jgi:hypothetical protein
MNRYFADKKCRMAPVIYLDSARYFESPLEKPLLFLQKTSTIGNSMITINSTFFRLDTYLRRDARYSSLETFCISSRSLL